MYRAEWDKLALDLEAHWAMKTELKLAYGHKLIEAMRYSLLAPGKRVRPLLFLSYLADEVSDLNPFYSFAGGLELIHCYTLIHDDLPAMDDDDWRRGLPANHKKFGEGTAILAGDALLTMAFQWLAEPLPLPAANQLQAIAVIAQKVGAEGVVGGQQADLDFEHAQHTTDKLALSQSLAWIHAHKTAYFFAAALAPASILLGETFGLAAFADSFGFYFQIQNDLKSENPTCGESSDSRKGKLTYLSLYGREGAQTYAQRYKNLSLLSLKKLEKTHPTFVAFAKSLL